MFSLELTKAVAVLESFNPRVEKHGEEKVPAMTLKLRANQGSDILAHFCPDLRTRLFTKKTDLAGEILSIRDPNEVFPMKRDESMTGATMSIAYGVGEPMAFTDVKVDDFSLTPQEGGTVVVVFKASMTGHAQHVEKLYALQEQEIEISIEPPELQELMQAAA